MCEMLQTCKEPLKAKDAPNDSGHKEGQGSSHEVLHLNSQSGLQEPMGEPTTIILRNRHSFKLSTKFISLYLCIGAPITPHKRHFFIQWLVFNTETHNGS